MSVVYLSVNEVINTAEAALGHLPEVRDFHLFQSAIQRPRLRAFGTEAYPRLYDKAAVLLESIAGHHLFWDGNKRSATAVTALFLARNGIRPTWTPEQVYAFMLEVAQGQHEVPSIAQWLEAHSQAT